MNLPSGVLQLVGTRAEERGASPPIAREIRIQSCITRRFVILIEGLGYSQDHDTAIMISNNDTLQ